MNKDLIEEEKTKLLINDIRHDMLKAFGIPESLFENMNASSDEDPFRSASSSEYYKQLTYMTEEMQKLNILINILKPYLLVRENVNIEKSQKEGRICFDYFLRVKQDASYKLLCELNEDEYYTIKEVLGQCYK